MEGVLASRTYTSLALNISRAIPVLVDFGISGPLVVATSVDM
jgi:hypothetical protein